MGFTEIEQEAIVLSAMIGMVDDMVNHSIWCIPGEKLEKTNLLPQTSTTLRLFGTLLRDFLSPLSVLRETKGLPFDLPKPPDPSAATDRTSLFYLKRIYENPLIGNDTTYLSLFVNEFAVWLEQYAVVEKLWLSRISIEVDLKIKRIDFIQICGDIGKHSFLRLGARTKTLQRILIENNVQIDDSQAYLALPDCWDWFHTHLLAYHASTIAEFLNNIRYAILLYIRPIARASYQVTGKIDEFMDMYTFERPDDIRDEFAWSQYFDLLQSSLRKPNFPRFSVTETLKQLF